MELIKHGNGRWTLRNIETGLTADIVLVKTPTKTLYTVEFNGRVVIEGLDNWNNAKGFARQAIR